MIVGIQLGHLKDVTWACVETELPSMHSCSWNPPTFGAVPYASGIKILTLCNDLKFVREFFGSNFLGHHVTVIVGQVALRILGICGAHFSNPPEGRNVNH